MSERDTCEKRNKRRNSPEPFGNYSIVRGCPRLCCYRKIEKSNELQEDTNAHFEMPRNECDMCFTERILTLKEN